MSVFKIQSKMPGHESNPGGQLPEPPAAEETVSYAPAEESFADRELRRQLELKFLSEESYLNRPLTDVGISQAAKGIAGNLQAWRAVLLLWGKVSDRHVLPTITVESILQTVTEEPVRLQSQTSHHQQVTRILESAVNLGQKPAR